jgi:hypothetical protein
MRASHRVVRPAHIPHGYSRCGGASLGLGIPSLSTLRCWEVNSNLIQAVLDNGGKAALPRVFDFGWELPSLRYTRPQTTCETRRSMSRKLIGGPNLELSFPEGVNLRSGRRILRCHTKRGVSVLVVCGNSWIPSRNGARKTGHNQRIASKYEHAPRPVACVLGTRMKS